MILSTQSNAQRLFNKADVAFKNKDYAKVVEIYDKCFDKYYVENSSSFIVLAETHYNLRLYPEALSYYKMVKNSEMTARCWYFYGEILRKQGLYNDALECYDKALKNEVKDISSDLVTLSIESCNWAISQKTEDKVLLEPTDFKTTKYPFGLGYDTDGGVIYSTLNQDNKKYQDKNGNLSYGFTHYSPKGNNIKSFEQFSGDSNVGSATFSADGKTIYYTKDVFIGKTVKSKIFCADYNERKNEWDKGKELKFCSEKYNFAHPALSSDGKTLFFASDIKGTIGGMDIFKSTFDGKKWSDPINMGEVINTVADEIFPRLLDNGHMSVSSNGHKGFGGFDIFWIGMNNGVPVSVKNALTPLNSTWDDFSIILNPQNDIEGYFSSNRGLQGVGDSIYSFKMTYHYIAEMQGIKIEEKEPDTISVVLEKPDTQKKVLKKPENTIKGAAAFGIEGYTLTIEGKKYLDAWADYLSNNPRVRVKLECHTDAKGGIDYNFNLSQRRAFEVKRYLMIKGVDHLAIIARGYGNRYPLVECADCTDEQLWPNRRIEINVISDKLN